MITNTVVGKLLETHTQWLEVLPSPASEQESTLAGNPVCLA